MSECEAVCGEVFLPDSATIKFACRLCDIKFSRRGNLNKHLKRFHQLEIALQKTQTCALCEEKFRTMLQLHEHIQNEHSITLKFGEETFYSEKDFLDWKNKLELESVSSFIKKNSWYESDGISHARYACRRSGHYEMKQSRIRLPKSKGSIKIGCTCPAFIKYFKQTIDGISEIKVKFQTVHLGHDLETKSLTLKKEEREGLAACLKLGISMDKILENAKQNFSSPNRYSNLTRKTLHNIRKDYGIPMNYVKPKKTKTLADSETYSFQYPQSADVEASNSSIGYEDYVEIELSNPDEIHEHEKSTAVSSLLLLKNQDYSKEFTDRKIKIINQLKEIQSRIEDWDPYCPLPDMEDHIKALNAHLDIYFSKRGLHAQGMSPFLTLGPLEEPPIKRRRTITKKDLKKKTI